MSTQVQRYRNKTSMHYTGMEAGLGRAAGTRTQEQERWVSGGWATHGMEATGSCPFLLRPSSGNGLGPSRRVQFRKK